VAGARQALPEVKGGCFKVLRLDMLFFFFLDLINDITNAYCHGWNISDGKRGWDILFAC
jgi:hypothetical protein